MLKCMICNTEFDTLEDLLTHLYEDEGVIDGLYDDDYISVLTTEKYGRYFGGG